jgi:hypothetical protein
MIREKKETRKLFHIASFIEYLFVSMSRMMTYSVTLPVYQQHNYAKSQSSRHIPFIVRLARMYKSPHSTTISRSSRDSTQVHVKFRILTESETTTQESLSKFNPPNSKPAHLCIIKLSFWLVLQEWNSIIRNGQHV